MSAGPSWESVAAAKRKANGVLRLIPAASVGRNARRALRQAGVLFAGQAAATAAARCLYTRWCCGLGRTRTGCNSTAARGGYFVNRQPDSSAVKPVWPL